MMFLKILSKISSRNLKINGFIQHFVVINKGERLQTVSGVSTMQGEHIDLTKKTKRKEGRKEERKKKILN